MPVRAWRFKSSHPHSPRDLAECELAGRSRRAGPTAQSGSQRPGEAGATVAADAAIKPFPRPRQGRHDCHCGGDSRRRLLRRRSRRASARGHDGGGRHPQVALAGVVRADAAVGQPRRLPPAHAGRAGRTRRARPVGAPGRKDPLALLDRGERLRRRRPSLATRRARGGPRRRPRLAERSLPRAAHHRRPRADRRRQALGPELRHRRQRHEDRDHRRRAAGDPSVFQPGRLRLSRRASRRGRRSTRLRR